VPGEERRLRRALPHLGCISPDLVQHLSPLHLGCISPDLVQHEGDAGDAEDEVLLPSQHDGAVHAAEEDRAVRERGAWPARWAWICERGVVERGVVERGVVERGVEERSRAV